ncbi:hypothetical protein Nepgr_000892 [Nepenthes gracilis]|uniref:BAH domain-containing protein n=1 Tax=Nepenthes gracilis TaxID=150966 RepID=A0AAD3P472_NEPGR|nr:hypothetical protein Nepgr_000892 [Nepenthes gracilis]
MHDMSCSVQDNEFDGIGFKWGIMRRRGGTKKDVQFYESFTFDDEEYFLYDSVYLFKDGEVEPYIGKLIKIWEHANKTKKVKVLWFFRPHEISNYIGGEKLLKNEILLATGNGRGLANINPLEAVAGKCNVVCISKDERNRQPSVEELKMADHIFFRTFDVDKCTISDKLGEEIAAIEVKNLLNKNNSENSSPKKFDSLWKEGSSNAVASSSKKETAFQKTGPEKAVKYSEYIGSSSVHEELDGMDSLAKRDYTAEEKHKNAPAVSHGIVSPISAEPEAGSRQMTMPRSLNLKRAEVAEVQMSAEDAENSNCGALRNSGINGINNANVHPYKKEKSEVLKDSGKLFVTAEVTSADNPAILNGASSKKRKYDGTVQPSKDHCKSIMQTSAARPDPNDVKALLPATTAAEHKFKAKLATDSHVLSNVLPEKMRSKGNLTKLPNDKLHKAALKHSNDKDAVTYGQVVEVTRKPDIDKSKWFTGLPWEDRVKNAFEQGTLVLLQNLDPTYTSSEVEDIVWHGCQENCTARMLQHTATSSPHTGQAFAIFKTREAAEKVIKKLEHGCLMLPNGRPLIGRIAVLSFPVKHSLFPGHLVVGKLKLHMQKDKKALSTSHSSQPNTLEYDMAMEWRLLQAQSELWWKRLYKQQGEELRKLKANLKSK